jgi:hypothetical protein
MIVEERIETTGFKKSFIFGLLLVSIRRTITAYSTNWLPLRQTVRWLEIVLKNNRPFQDGCLVSSRIRSGAAYRLNRLRLA